MVLLMWAVVLIGPLTGALAVQYGIEGDRGGWKTLAWVIAAGTVGFAVGAADQVPPFVLPGRFSDGNLWALTTVDGVVSAAALVARNLALTTAVGVLLNVGGLVRWLRGGRVPLPRAETAAADESTTGTDAG